MKKYSGLLLINILLAVLLFNACGASPPPSVTSPPASGNGTSLVSKNSPPDIESLTARPPEIGRGKKTVITCRAADADGDKLTYSWSASGGTIEAGSSTASWTAPQEPGDYLINVIVQDTKGGKDTAEVSLKVLSNTPPVVESLVATPAVLHHGKPTSIACRATDNEGDALTYKWKADQGQITGDGPTVSWTAPSGEGHFEVSVEVTDAGNSFSTMSIYIDVLPNRSPVIRSLTADPEGVDPGEKTAITCTAVDEDGDTLQYLWGAAQGVISGSGNVVEWTAPSVFEKTQITVKVTDGHGGETPGDMEIALPCG
jgi:hypothetical protein